MEILRDICNNCGIWTEKLDFNMDDHYFYIRKRDNMSIYHDISNSWNIEIIKKLIMSKPEWLSVNELFSCCVVTEYSLVWNDIYYTQKKIQKCFDKYGYFHPTIKNISEFNNMAVKCSSDTIKNILFTLIKDGKYLPLSDIIQVYYHHGGKAVK
jgi:hypothetical protein